uniref:Uncharacterized protein n=1 Tax=Anguilla anguilla TaxID=7936 RepID=A0A0E9UNJ3_ANGAN
MHSRIQEPKIYFLCQSSSVLAQTAVSHLLSKMYFKNQKRFETVRPVEMLSTL